MEVNPKILIKEEHKEKILIPFNQIMIMILLDKWVHLEETKVVDMALMIAVAVIEMLVVLVAIKGCNHKNSHLVQYLDHISQQFQCGEVVRKINNTFKIYSKRNIKIK